MYPIFSAPWILPAGFESDLEVSLSGPSGDFFDLYTPRETLGNLNPAAMELCSQLDRSMHRTINVKT